MSKRKTRTTRTGPRRLSILAACAAFGVASLGAAQAALAKPGDRHERVQIARAGDDVRAERRGDWRAQRHERRRAKLARYDRDGDGRLDEREKRAMVRHRAERRFERMDLNGDGRITRSEFVRAAEQRMEARGDRRGGHKGTRRHHRGHRGGGSR